MYTVPPYGRTSCDYIVEVTILSWFYDPNRIKTPIRLGICSVSPSDKSPRCSHEENFGEIIDFYSAPKKKKKKKKKKFAQGVFRGETRKKSFFLGWSVRMSTFWNIFSSETTSPFKVKFHMEPPWDLGTKVYSTGPGHMTKMAAMPIYGKNLKKSSPEPKGRWPWNLVCSIGCSSITNYVQMMTLGWPWPILRQGQIWPFTLCMGKR